jgi:hypothetical protein
MTAAQVPIDLFHWTMPTLSILALVGGQGQ